MSIAIVTIAGASIGCRDNKNSCVEKNGLRSTVAGLSKCFSKVLEEHVRANPPEGTCAFAFGFDFATLTFSPISEQVNFPTLKFWPLTKSNVIDVSDVDTSNLAAKDGGGNYIGLTRRSTGESVVVHSVGTVRIVSETEIMVSVQEISTPVGLVERWYSVRELEPDGFDVTESTSRLKI